ncbi:DUF4279 domain-containing protein [Sphingobium sp. HBC34]|uniref:DUF4279 domain-containing protein n=1 Tax=Sphingobium cyanobacteriorum TaxID=3063954 RepID=A0ABT8ZJX0_9SPHN|nr:DUF4279 domain-containing protein [Sphingobium sp. HBC34]MDO7834516.1 DUF4279 domain-containing protein [Sphingobium sp. HBC34]
MHKSAATLGFYGDDLDPEEITNFLRIEPTVGTRKGGVWLTGSGVEKTARTGVWRLVADRCEPADLDGQIGWLLSPLPNNLEIWRSLAARYRGRIFAGLFMHSGNEGLTLQPDTLSMMGGRGLVLDLDIYGAEMPE